MGTATMAASNPKVKPMPIRLDYSQISNPKKKKAAPAKPKTTSKGSSDPAAARRLEQEAIRKNFESEWYKRNTGVGPGRAPKKPTLGQLGEARWKKFAREQDTKRTFAQGGSGAKRDPRYDRDR